MTPKRDPEEILRRIEEAPEQPYLLINDAEAVEAMARISPRHKNARLILMRGMRYITITDAATEVILERLERERQGYIQTIEVYDKEIADIRALLGTEARTCFTRGRRPETEGRTGPCLK